MSRPRTITVPTVNGPRRVPVRYWRGVWAITPRLTPGGKRGYIKGRATVTHAPTGQGIPDPWDDLTPKLARDLVRRLPKAFQADAVFNKRQTKTAGPMPGSDVVRDAVLEFRREHGIEV